MELYLRYFFAHRWALIPALLGAITVSMIASGTFYLAAIMVLLVYASYRVVNLLAPESFWRRKMFGVYDIIALIIVSYVLLPLGVLFWLLGMVAWIGIDLNIGTRYR